MRLSLTLALLLASCAVQHPAHTVTAVSVRSTDLGLTKSLTPDEVTEFKRLWADRTKVALQLGEAGGTFVILDIAGYGGARWYYKSSGYAQVLSIGRTPVYKLGDVDAFNTLIGVAR